MNRIPLKKRKIGKYTVCSDFTPKRGGFALLYKVQDETGKFFMAKEVYPSQSCDLNEWLYRKEDGTICLSDDTAFASFNVEAAWTAFKESAKNEQRLVNKICTSSRFSTSNNDDYILKIREILEENGTCYAIIETVDSQTFEEYIHSNYDNSNLEKKFPDIIKMMVLACEAVDHLHQKGYLHSDISPDNMLLSNAGMLRLIDYNTSHKLGAFDDSECFSSKFGYSSPELLSLQRGWRSVEELVPGIDVFSLGAILFRIIFLHPPKSEDITNPERWHNELFKKFRNEDTAKALENVLRTALHADIDQRYKTVKLLLKDLRKIKKNLEASPYLKLINTLNGLYRISEKKGKKAKKRLWTACVALFATVLLVSAYFVSLPNQMDFAANRALANGKAQKAYSKFMDIKDRLQNPGAWIYSCYDESKLLNLGHKILSSGEIQSTITFSDKIEQVGLNDFFVTALLKNQIEFRERETGEFAGTCEAPTSKEVLLSPTGEYLAFLESNHLNLYAVEIPTAIISINDINDVKNFVFDTATENLLLFVRTDGSYGIFDFQTLRCTKGVGTLKGCQPFKHNLKTVAFNSETQLLAYKTSEGNALVQDLAGNVLGQLPLLMLDMFEALTPQYETESGIGIDLMGLKSKPDTVSIIANVPPVGADVRFLDTNEPVDFHLRFSAIYGNTLYDVYQGNPGQLFLLDMLSGEEYSFALPDINGLKEIVVPSADNLVLAFSDKISLYQLDLNESSAILSASFPCEQFLISEDKQHMALIKNNQLLSLFFNGSEWIQLLAEPIPEGYTFSNGVFGTDGSFWIVLKEQVATNHISRQYDASGRLIKEHNHGNIAPIAVSSDMEHSLTFKKAKAALTNQRSGSKRTFTLPQIPTECRFAGEHLVSFLPSDSMFGDIYVDGDKIASKVISSTIGIERASGFSIFGDDIQYVSVDEKGQGIFNFYNVPTKRQIAIPITIPFVSAQRIVPLDTQTAILFMQQGDVLWSTIEKNYSLSEMTAKLQARYE